MRDIKGEPKIALKHIRNEGFLDDLFPSISLCSIVVAQARQRSSMNSAQLHAMASMHGAQAWRPRRNLLSVMLL